MSSKAALGLIFAIAFVCGSIEAAILQGYEFEHALRIQHVSQEGQLRLPSVTTDISQATPAPKAKGPLSGKPLPKEGWKVTCDSEDKANNHTCNWVKDGNFTSFWLTAPPSSKDTPPKAHWITIELEKAVFVNGIGVFARQDEDMNGVITSHEVYISDSFDDSGRGRQAAYGTWWNDKLSDKLDDNNKILSSSSEKYANFEPIQAKFVHLRAIPQASIKGFSTSIAEINVYHIPDYKDPTITGRGKWGPTIDFPLVPAGAWVDPMSGNVVTFSSDSHDGDGPNPGNDRTMLATWNRTDKTVSDLRLDFTNHQMFCPGMTLDANGRIIVTGGATSSKTSIFDPKTGKWQQAAPMKVKRGYQSSTINANGNIFVIGGSWNGGNGRKNGERFVPQSGKDGKWEKLAQCPVLPMQTEDQRDINEDKVYRADNHGWLFGWKDNVVFQAGPSKNMNWYTVTDTGGTRKAGARSDDDHAMCGIAVMYDATAGKILTAGGATSYDCTPSSKNAYVITLKESNDAQPDVQKIKAMNYSRIFHNAVILPDGQTFVAGGQSKGWVWTDTLARMTPEMFDPNNLKAPWTDMASNSIVRNYHSIGLLLPDATVFVGGGGLCGDCDEKCDGEHAADGGQKNNHFDGQIYTPPYLLDSANQPVKARPRILAVSPKEVNPGGKITITTKTAIKAASLIRYGSTTHGLNTDQRRVPCTPQQKTGTFEYTCNIPAAGVATPGYWMVFVLDAAGVPSVAETIRVTTT